MSTLNPVSGNCPDCLVTPLDPCNGGSIVVANDQIDIHYIAARVDNVDGSGDAHDPRDGSTASKIDAIFASRTGPTLFVFFPGLYLTNGIIMHDKQHILGSGIDLTIIRLAANVFNGGGGNYPVIQYYGNAVDGTSHTVRQLTVDPNCGSQFGVTNAATGYVGGINLQTQYGVIEDVKILGIYSNPGEGFPISIYCQAAGRTQATPAVARIKRLQYVGRNNTLGFATLISCFDQSGGAAYANEWMTGEITDCVVTNEARFAGFGAGGWDGFTIARNRTHNIGTFMIQDTHRGWNVTVEDNVANDLFGSNSGGNQWFLLANGNNATQYKNYKVINNVIRPKSTTPVATNTCAFQIQSPDMADLLIAGNILDWGAVAQNQAFVISAVAAGGVIRNNRLSSQLQIQTGLYITGVTTEGNVYFDNTPVRDLQVGYALKSGCPVLMKYKAAVNLKNTGVTDIFTVPTGFTFVLMDAWIQATTIAALSAGATAQIQESGASGLMSAITQTNSMVTGQDQVFPRPNASRPTCAAGNKVQVNVTAGATATTDIADVYVLGFYL